MLTFIMYAYILNIINTIFAYNMYEYFISKNLKINKENIKINNFSFNKIESNNKYNDTSKLILINDFIDIISEIKILLSCFDLIYINMKHIPVYKLGLYYGISNKEDDGLIFAPSSYGITTNKSNLLLNIINSNINNTKDNLAKFGFPNINYSNNIKYSHNKKTIFIHNISGKETDSIVLSNINSSNAVDIIQKTLFIILNCRINNV